MCDAMEKIRNAGFERGFERGRKEGREESARAFIIALREIGQTDPAIGAQLCNLMGYSADQATDLVRTTPAG